MAADANVLDQARSLIEDRLKELDGERKRLETALANLKGGGRRPGRGRRARRRSLGLRRRADLCGRGRDEPARQDNRDDDEGREAMGLHGLRRILAMRGRNCQRPASFATS